MAAIIDILMSMLVGSMLLLNVLNAQDLVGEISSMGNGDALVQEMLIIQVQFLEGEMRNMGYGVPPGEQVILAASDSAMTFLMDCDRDGTVDTVSYILGPTSELAGTPNQMDRYIHRVVNGGVTENVGVVTLLLFRYLSATGDTLLTPVSASDLGRIKEVEITMEVQNPHALYRPQGMVMAGQRDALYSTSYWQQTRLASQNFRR